MDGIVLPDIIGLIVGAVVTLIIFSYLLGDNILYRWVLALLVGSGAGYVMGVVIRFVLVEWFVEMGDAPTQAAKIFYFVPIFLGVLLLLKGFSSFKLLGRLAVVGNIAMGYLLGAGAAVAIAGALLGTLFPQISATGRAVTLNNLPWGLLQGAVMALGTITALLFFSPRPTTQNGEVKPAARWVQRIGQFFIIVALAAAFAGAVTSGLTLWVERWSALIELALQFIGG